MAVRELLRILAPGGKLLIYVWAMEQELHKIKSKYLKESKLQNHDHSTRVMSLVDKYFLLIVSMEIFGSLMF
jgi:hypothetical protein